jgi:hypothetical protein
MGLFDFLSKGSGTPQVTATPNSFIDPRQGAVTQMPTISAPKQPGFLDRLKEPDDRGLTFGDKLFAAGGVLQGDSGGAMSYLQNQRLMSRHLADQDDVKAGHKRRSAAFKAAMTGGKFDPAIYSQLADEDFDPSDLAAMQNAFGTKPRSGQFLQGAGGQLGYGDPDTGSYREINPAIPKPPGPLVQDDNGDWVENPAYIALQEHVAAAKRKGAPLAPRRASGGGRGRAPKSYGADEVSF